MIASGMMDIIAHKRKTYLPTRQSRVTSYTSLTRKTGFSTHVSSRKIENMNVKTIKT